MNEDDIKITNQGKMEPPLTLKQGLCNLKKEIKDEKLYKRYVAYFDVLGFKTATLRNPDEAWGALSDLRICMDEAIYCSIHVSKPELLVVPNRLKAFIFSDSVLIYSFSNEAIDLMAILILTSQFFGKSLNRCLPLRGGISYGDFFFNVE